MKFLSNSELNRPDKETYSAIRKLPVTVVLDNVRSGLNIGSIFRTSDSFLVERIMLCGISGCPPDREILKTALGATETVAWSYHKSTAEALEILQHQHYRIFAVEQGEGSMAPDEFMPPDSPFAVIFGHEVKGVDKELIRYLDGCIEIPQSGTKHSLNVAVTAGIVLWELFKKMKH